MYDCVDMSSVSLWLWGLGLLEIGGGSETMFRADAVIVTGLENFVDERRYGLGLRWRPAASCNLYW